MYIQYAVLNGNVLNKPWISHYDIISGGTLELQMGNKPNVDWGKQQSERINKSQ